MNLLQKIVAASGSVSHSVTRTLRSSLAKTCGSANARYLKRLKPKLLAINALEPTFQKLTTKALAGMTDDFRKRLGNGESLDDLLVEAFALCREAGRRSIGLRHYDVQLLGGMVLHNADVAEMATGEGKTLVAVLPKGCDCSHKCGTKFGSELPISISV